MHTLWRSRISSCYHKYIQSKHPPKLEAVEEGHAQETGRRLTWYNRLTVRLGLFTGFVTALSVGLLALQVVLYISKYHSAETALRLQTVASTRRNLFINGMKCLEQSAQFASSRDSIRQLLVTVDQNMTVTTEATRSAKRDADAIFQFFPGVISATILDLKGNPVFAPHCINAKLGIIKEPTWDDAMWNDDVKGSVGCLLDNSRRVLQWNISQPVYDKATPQVIGTLRLLARSTFAEEVDADRTGLHFAEHIVIAPIVSMGPTGPRPRDGVASEIPDQFQRTSVSGFFKKVVKKALAMESHLPIPSRGFGDVDGITFAYELFDAGRNEEPWIVIVWVPTIALKGGQRRFEWRFCVSMVVAIVSALAASFPFARQILRPLKRLEEYTAKLRQGNFRKVPSFDLSPCKEVEELIMTFNTMAEDLSSLYGSLEEKIQERTAALQKACIQAETSNRSKSTFVAMITHELRTPLNGVIGLSDLLAQTLLDDDQRDMVATIKECSDGLLAIINDVLDFSKIEAGKLELETRRFDILQAVQHTLRLLRTKASEKGVPLLFTFQANIPQFVWSDSNRLKQILMNLISNSIKFTVVGTISVDLKCRPLAASEWEFTFSVSDTGIGIEHEALQTLFHPFTQVDCSIARQHGGTGLGLTISRQLVEKMGGSISVDSTVGKGTTFLFSIRCLKAPDTVIPPVARNVPNNLLADEAPHKILVAEDNVVNQKLLIRLLAKLGYTAHVVENGLQAVDAIKQNPTYDVIFMDMQMPIMDGLEATRKIREGSSLAETPYIIALTANVWNEDRERCLQAGMNAYLTKPVTLEMLAATLKNIGSSMKEKKR